MTGNESDPAKDPDKTVFDADSVFGGDADSSSDGGREADDIWGPFTGGTAPDHSTQVLESDAFGRARPFLSEDTDDPFAGDQNPWSPGDDEPGGAPGGRDPWGPPAFSDQPAEPAAHVEHEVPPPWEFESGGPPGPWSPPAAGGQPWQPAPPAADNGQQPWQPQQPPQPAQPDDGFDPFNAPPGAGGDFGAPPGAGGDQFGAPPGTGGGQFGTPPGPGGEQFGAPPGTSAPFSAPSEPGEFGAPPGAGDQFGSPPGSAGDQRGGIPSFDAPQPGTEVPNPFATADFGAPAESTPSPFDDDRTGEASSFWPSAQQPDPADPDHPTDVLPKPSGNQPARDASPFDRPGDPQPTSFDSGQPGRPDAGGELLSPFDQDPDDVGPSGRPWQPGDADQPAQPDGRLLSPFDQPQEPDTGQPWHPGGIGQPGSGQPSPFGQPWQPSAGDAGQPGPWPANAGQQAPQQQPPPPPQQQQQQAPPRYDLSQFQQGYQGQQPAQPPQPPPPPPQPHDPRQQFGYPQQQPGGQQFPNMGPPLEMPPQQPIPLTSENLSPQSLLRQRKAPPSSGWRRAVFKVSGGLLDPGESNKEVQRQQMISLVRTPVAGGHYRVAVLSLKGGVGKTTTTVGLGSTLASLRGDRIIAVDANPDRGTLSEKVRLETRANVRDLLSNRETVQRYSDVRQYTSQAASRLEVLASDPDPAISEAFSENAYRAIADVLEHYYSICLTDCGTGLLHSAMRGVLGLADQIVLVSSASVDGARSASATLDWLDAHDYGDLVQSGVVVMSAVRPQNKAVDLSRLEQHFSARCRALVRIPFDPHLEAGAEFVLEQLSAPTRDAYLELTAAVAAGFQYRLPR